MAPNQTDKLASLEDYEALMEDHPQKFTAKQVGFKRDGAEGGEVGRSCSTCLHFYNGMYRSVCEIFRPEDGTDTIMPLDRCLFWTQDGHTFPLLPR